MMSVKWRELENMVTPIGSLVVAPFKQPKLSTLMGLNTCICSKNCI